MKVKIVTNSPSDRNRVTWIDSSIAWYAAQGIAKLSHHAVILYGKYATVRFDYLGGGTCVWNEKSTLPGDVTKFSPETTVCVN